MSLISFLLFFTAAECLWSVVMSWSANELISAIRLLFAVSSVIRPCEMSVNLLRTVLPKLKPLMQRSHLQPQHGARILYSLMTYIEDITWPRGDTKFLFECWKIFHEWAQRTSEIFFQHEKRNFVSPSGHVMFYLLYKHQWTTKPFHFNSFLAWKARFIMYP